MVYMIGEWHNHNRMSYEFLDAKAHCILNWCLLTQSIQNMWLVNLAASYNWVIQ